MKLRSGMIFTLAASLVLGGCAAGAAGGGAAAGPTTSPTGKAYAPGTRPTESKFTTPAKLFIAQGQFQQALEQAQQGIAADSTNAQHYFIAGQAYVGLEDYESANEMFQRAEQIYPAYELEIEPVREQAWATAFNAGVNAYNAGNNEEAVEAWERANLIFSVRPEGFQNLAAVYTQASNYDQAIAAYRAGLAALGRTPAARQLTAEEQTERAEVRATMVENLAELLSFTEQYADAEKLFREQLQADSANVGLQAKLAAAIAAQPGRASEAQAIYTRLLAQPNLTANQLMSVGVALFNAKEYAQAADAFRRVAEQRPNSRDAWYNYANALYAAERFQPLVGVAEKLVAIDPLNEDAALILARAYKESKQNQKALQALQKNETLPVKVKDLEMRVSEGKTTVRGKVVGNTARAGSPVQLRFNFFGDNGALGTQTVTVNAPAKDATTNFEVVLENPTAAVGYTYDLVR